MKKNWMKLSLDLIMAVGLFSLFSVSAVGLAFHEVVGLTLFGATLLHLTLNRKWIVSFTRRFFSKNIPLKIRFSYVLSVLLLISFLIIIGSGITMSKFVFAGVFEEVETFKTAHYFFSAFALLLIGIHAGLHWTFLKLMVGKIVKIPASVVKPVMAGMLMLIMVSGAWGLVNSSFVAWIASPIVALPENEGGWPEGTEGRGGGRGRDSESLVEEVDHVETEVDHEETEEGIRGYRGGLGATFDPIKTIEVVAEYGSIMILIASFTAGAEVLIRKSKQKKVVI
jgi:hypothetical protein